MKTFFTWKEGRQNTNYFKMKLLEWLCVDLYLLCFPKGSYVAPHRDPVPGKKHYRINFLLKGADTFYTVNTEKGTIFHWWRIVIFRSDLLMHALGKVPSKTFILSFGLVTKM